MVITMSKKGKSALVLGASKDKLFAVGTFLISLRKTNPNFTDDIIVFYDEIDVLEKEKFSKLGNVILKKYDCPFKKLDNLSYFVKDLFTLMVFSKYECLRLLSTYSTVVWMDYDMYVLDNIDELLIPVKEGVKAIVTEKLSDSLLEKNNPFKNEKINGFHSSVFVLYALREYSSALSNMFCFISSDIVRLEMIGLLILLSPFILCSPF